jgi:hypothetical protein
MTFPQFSTEKERISTNTVTLKYKALLFHGMGRFASSFGSSMTLEARKRLFRQVVWVRTRSIIQETTKSIGRQLTHSKSIAEEFQLLLR